MEDTYTRLLNCTHSVRRSFLLASQPPAFMPSKWHPNHGNNEIIMELEAWGIDCHHEERRGGGGGGPDAWALGGKVRVRSKGREGGCSGKAGPV
jgi:hypothetical protein